MENSNLNYTFLKLLSNRWQDLCWNVVKNFDLLMNKPLRKKVNQLNSLLYEALIISMTLHSKKSYLYLLNQTWFLLLDLF